MGLNSVISCDVAKGSARFAALQEYAEEQSGLNDAEGDEHEDDCFDVHRNFGCIALVPAIGEHPRLWVGRDLSSLGLIRACVCQP